MQITLVQTADLETLRAFAERTFRIAFQAENDPYRFEQYCLNAFSTEQFKNELSHPNSSFWFAWENERLAAYIKLNFDQHPADLGSQNTVQVERLYVEPELQGRRIGEKLLDFAHEQAVLKQADWLWLSVWQARPNSLRFYERCGYQIFGTETFWLADEAQLDWLVKKPVKLNRE